MEDQKDTNNKAITVAKPRRSHSRKTSKSAKSSNQMVQMARNTKQTLSDKAHQYKQTVSEQTKGMRQDMPGTIAKGAAGVAVTAGVIAAGAALSKRENRDKLSKGARRTFNMLQDVVGTMLEEDPEMLQQLPRMPRILRRHRITLLQRPQRPQRDILQIPDRRGHEIQRPGSQRR